MAQDTCALRRAGRDDAAAIERFLSGHAETSMFLRSNLAAHGIGDSTARAATDFVIAQDAEGIKAVFGITRAGYVLVQMPNPVPEIPILQHMWAGRAVMGLTGVPHQVAAMLTALGLEQRVPALDDNEPLYTLALGDLAVPRVVVHPPTPADHTLLAGWFAAYGRETGTAFTDAEAQERATRAVETAGTRLLKVEDRPVAMTAINAKVSDMVQVGGVFVPPALRARGYGRHVVAGHLQEARDAGMSRAILFAANAAAARAYEAIGFTRIGDYRIVMYANPVTI
ncbi:GNAT family N-acetyltransferase [uncultured Tateyamaria sp.]|uniref:GNAT family N-acetyltransferase n=1 Tax=uncultured Tateyamaria sp. TaxID=455651 RepID=UPI0026128B0B|nr:GNAT family N-acetyltransferase [uncultured Tateyamaria sp.]